MRATMFKPIPTLLMVGLLVGCGGAIQGPRSIDELRRAANERPEAVGAQISRGIGEYLASGGEPSEAEAILQNALAGPAADAYPEARLLLGLIHHFRGNPAEALNGLLAVLESCTEVPAPHCSDASEVAALALRELADVAPAFRPRVDEVLPAVLEEAAQPLGPETRFQLGRILMQRALADGSRERSEALESSLGCVDRWRVAGPFGPWNLLGFDEALAPEEDAELATSYDLGPGAGEGATRDAQSTACAVNIGNSELTSGGTFYAEAFVDVADASAYDIRIDTPNSFELDIGGAFDLRVDHRARPAARTHLRRVQLPAGRHRVRIKVSTRHHNPVFSLSLQPARGPNQSELPEVISHISRYLRASLAMGRGDAIETRETLRTALDEAQASAMLLTLGSLAAISDPLRSQRMRRDRARQLLQLAQEREPEAWYPPTQLARLRSAEGQSLQAIEDLRAVRDRWPSITIPHITLAELYSQRGFLPQAARALEPALALNPHSCGAINTALGLAESLQQAQEIAELSERLTECDARRSARFRRLVQARRWQAAETELNRLRSLYDSAGALRRFSPARLGMAVGQLDREAILSTIAQLQEAQPRSELYTSGRVDALIAAGQDEEARQFISTALDRAPGSLGELRRVQRTMGEQDIFSEWRLDGLEVIRAFEASGRSYDEPDVMVLDYTVIRVFEDGSTAELTHNIHRLQSEEAVDAHGEYSRRENTRITRLRTIKADGRVLEPDEIAGKETISLPSLMPGDYVETEYVRYSEPLRAGGARGWRFYFQSAATPMDRTELVVISPAGQELVLEPRGDAPQAERSVVGGLQVHRWALQESRPRPTEPSSVSAEDFMPSIHWGIGADWNGYVGSLTDELADRDVYDPAAERLLDEILGSAREADDETRARRIYHWVLENVESAQNLFGQAAAMVAQQRGSRGRALHYLLRLSGIESRIVMSSTLSAPQIPSAISRDNEFNHLVVEARLRDPDQTVYLSTGQRYIPFGYLSESFLGQNGLYLQRDLEEVTLPEHSHPRDQAEIDAEIRLSGDGSASIRVRETLRGSGAIRWRNDLDQVADAVLEQQFGEFYVSRLLPGAALQSLEIHNRRDAESPLILEYAFEVDTIGRRNDEAWAIPPLFPHQFLARYANVDRRTTTQILFPRPNIEVNLRVIPPSGGEFVMNQQEDEQVANTTLGLAASNRMRLDDGVLVSTRRIQFSPSLIPAEAYPALVDFCRQADVVDRREINIRLTP